MRPIVLIVVRSMLRYARSQHFCGKVIMWGRGSMRGSMWSWCSEFRLWWSRVEGWRLLRASGLLKVLNRVAGRVSDDVKDVY